jgi:hypothetical protein
VKTSDQVRSRESEQHRSCASWITHSGSKMRSTRAMYAMWLAMAHMNLSRPPRAPRHESLVSCLPTEVFSKKSTVNKKGDMSPVIGGPAVHEPSVRLCKFHAGDGGKYVPGLRTSPSALHSHASLTPGAILPKSIHPPPLSSTSLTSPSQPCRTCQST